MAKEASDTVLDAGLDVIATCTEQYLCTAQPTDRANAIALSVVPAIVMTGGDYSKSDDATNTGRKVTIASKTGLTANASGDVTHAVLCTATTLEYTTTTPTTTVSSGNTVNVGSWEVTIQDPT